MEAAYHQALPVCVQRAARVECANNFHVGNGASRLILGEPTAFNIMCVHHLCVNYADDCVPGFVSCLMQKPTRQCLGVHSLPYAKNLYHRATRSAKLV
jgi:hypothetical protein